MATLDSLLPTLRRVVVPGHGAVADPGLAAAQRDDPADAVAPARAGRLDDGPWPAEVVAAVRVRLDAST